MALDVKVKGVLLLVRSWYTPAERLSTEQLPQSFSLEQERTNNPISLHQFGVPWPPLVPVRLAEIIVKNLICSFRISAVYHLSRFPLTPPAENFPSSLCLSVGEY